MINIKDREQKVIQWHFPDDKEDSTVFHLSWLSGPKEGYLRLMRAGSGSDLAYDEWMAESLINSIVQIDNWNGKTLKSTDDIKNAIDLFTENEIYLLMSAIRRDGDAFRLGVIEKN